MPSTQYYHCFDASGAQVASVEPSEAVASLGCSQAQLDAWVAAYATPCCKLVPLADQAPFLWQDVLGQLLAAFTTCEAAYAW